MEGDFNKIMRNMIADASNSEYEKVSVYLSFLSLLTFLIIIFLAYRDSLKLHIILIPKSQKKNI